MFSNNQEKSHPQKRERLRPKSSQKLGRIPVRKNLSLLEKRTVVLVRKIQIWVIQLTERSANQIV